MKKNTKSFLIITTILIGVFSLFFNYNNNVNAQVEDNVYVQTAGYSVLSASSYIFRGYYDGYHGSRGFTTYFEFKKDNQNLDVDTKETIKIVRDIDVQEFGEFFTSPELEVFSNYYFRAVGYFNDNPSQKFYGDIQNIRTGVFPKGISSYPFNVGRGSITNIKGGIYDIKGSIDDIKSGVDGDRGGISSTPICVSRSLNVLTNSCDTPPAGTSCAPGVYSYLARKCVSTAPAPTLTISASPTDVAINNESRITWSSTNTESTCEASGNGWRGIGVRSSSGSEPSIVLWKPGTYSFIIKCKGLNGIAIAKSIAVTVRNNPTDTNSSSDPELNVPTGGLVKCTENCGFKEAIELINDVIDFIFKYLVLPLAAIMFAYAGFELVTSGGSTEKKSKAKSIITNVAIGLILAAGAYVIVQTVLSVMGFTGTTFL